MIKFTVPGNPIPCERPRVVKGRAFTPKKSKDYQGRVRDAYRATPVPAAEVCTDNPLAVVLTFYRGDKRRCDLDNLAKSVLDGLNGVAFLDDSQIVKLAAIKNYDRANPRAEIEIIEVEQ